MVKKKPPSSKVTGRRRSTSVSPATREPRLARSTAPRAELADVIVEETLVETQRRELLELEHPEHVEPPAREATPRKAPDRKGASQEYDLLDLIDRRLRARITLAGVGKRRAQRIAAHVAAEKYVEHMVAGHFKFLRDYADRKYGRPTQRISVGRDAVDEFRDFLTEPRPMSERADAELAELAALAALVSGPGGERLASLVAGLRARLGSE